MALYLIAGHGGTDPGATANGVQEADLTAELVELIADELKGYETVHALSDRSDGFAKDLAHVRKNAAAEDTVIDFHFNAFHSEQAHGTEVYYTPSDSTPPIQLGQNIIAAIQKSTGTRSRGVKPESNSQHARLAMLHTKAKDELLVEVCFITNTQDLDAYQSNKKQVAKDLASCFIQAGLVIKPKPKRKKKTESEESES